MYRNIADELYRLLYDTFERRPGDAARTIFAAKSIANEMQYDMMRKVAELKATSDRTAAGALLDAISSDALLAESMGYMTRETNDRIQDIISVQERS